MKRVWEQGLSVMFTPVVFIKSPTGLLYLVDNGALFTGEIEIHFSDVRVTWAFTISVISSSL